MASAPNLTSSPPVLSWLAGYARPLMLVCNLQRCYAMSWRPRQMSCAHTIFSRRVPLRTLLPADREHRRRPEGFRQRWSPAHQQLRQPPFQRCARARSVGSRPEVWWLLQGARRNHYVCLLAANHACLWCGSLGTGRSRKAWRNPDAFLHNLSSDTELNST